MLQLYEETSIKLTHSTFRLSLVRCCLSLDFSWYDRKQASQDLSLVKLETSFHSQSEMSQDRQAFQKKRSIKHCNLS